MGHLRRAVAAALVAVLYSAASLSAAEKVGEAVLIKTEVTGENGPIAVNGDVHRDERIRTSQSGLGQFLFRDGTKLAVGWGSSVTVDKFVFDDSKSVQKLTIKAAKGTFRWISGSAKSSAYEILTPAGTIGVRGTAFDVHIAPNGTTAVVLLSGAVQFCGAGACRQLTRRCDVVIARPGGRPSDPRRVDLPTLRSLGGPRSLPFLSGNQRLAGQLSNVGNGGCGLIASNDDRQDRNRPRDERQRQDAPKPDKPTPGTPSDPGKPTENNDPGTPSEPNEPTDPGTPDQPTDPGTPSEPGTPTDAGEPSTPSEPTKPEKPDKPDKPDRGHHDHHDRPDKPDKPDRDHDRNDDDDHDHGGKHDRDGHDNDGNDRDHKGRDKSR